MDKEEIENYITELESMFELSELEENSRNILKVGIYIKQLQQENQELKKQLEVGEEQYNDLVEEKEILLEQLSIKTLQLKELKEQVNKGLYNICLPYKTGYDKAIKDKEIQQKEFIEYMNKTIEELECDDVDDEEMKGYLIQIIDTFKEILQKYKEIIGDDI